MLNSLVAYGSDSDEEGSPSNRHFVRRSPDNNRSSSNAKKKLRKDSEVMFEEDSSSSRSNSQSCSPPSELYEPPPPKRRATNADGSPISESNTPQNLGGFHQVSSTVSLASMNVMGGQDGREDAFEQADREANEHADRDQSRTPDSASRIEEPKPPERHSQEDNTDEDEKLIDVEVEEAQKFLRQLHEPAAVSSNMASPANYDDSPNTRDGPMTPDRDGTQAVVEYEGDVRLPPHPTGECDPVLQRKFEGFFGAKGRGVDMNGQIKNQKVYQNPSSYEKFIEEFGLDEKGSNFLPSIFDPHGFPDNCFYEHLAELQRIASEQQPPPGMKKTTSAPAVSQKK